MTSKCWAETSPFCSNYTSVGQSVPDPNMLHIPHQTNKRINLPEGVLRDQVEYVYDICKSLGKHIVGYKYI